MYFQELENEQVKSLYDNLISNLDTALSININSQILHFILKNLEMYISNNNYPSPPYSDFEITDQYRFIVNIYNNIIQSDFNLESFIESTTDLENKQILTLQGMRITEGSVFTRVKFPGKQFLIDIANKYYNEFLTHLARARAKHSFRCEVSYWGEIKGSPQDQNEDSNHFLEKLLNEFTWWNYFEHFKHGLVLELRDKTGHGMRWSIDEELFLGLIEPIDPNLGRKFWNNKLN